MTDRTAVADAVASTQRVRVVVLLFSDAEGSEPTTRDGIPAG